ncbi:UDP-glycosyltransferase UGT5 isoform X2 [Aethina tumida]|uniref:UDP-glycosyltransferase UGT5 isoform X2 n=1 Tax=Aethina tumida TaxID=116153 RepID=UPI0021483786|nr:UDP-glycosyltransferase UGT5 isoform X2 [Aethina tumida]
MKSHHIWNLALTKGLIAKGHNVTLLEPGAKESETELYHPIDLEELELVVEDIAEVAKQSFSDKVEFFFSMVNSICKDVYRSNKIDEIIRNKNRYKFDMLIIDLTIFPCMLPLIQEFDKLPVVGVSAFLLPPELSHIFGNNLYPAYLPHYYLTASDNMDFYTRLQNFLVTYYVEYIYESNIPHYENMARQKFGNHIRPFKELLKKVSLLLSNTNPIFDYPQPLPPTIIPVGGLHARPGKKLPKDLQELMDKSTNGVIVFSLGTNIKSEKLDVHKRKIILDAFAQLNEIVIWKFEKELLDLPKNVFVRKWLPQNDVIAHPNVKLFIGHGGALSTQEAFYHGVPIIGIPFFVDQHINVQTFSERKRGLRLDINSITTENLVETIREAINNPLYRRNVQDISRRFKDLPTTSLDSAVFWIEYVLKHNGTSFLDVRARSMNFLQYTSLDVILFLILLSLGGVLLLYLISKHFLFNHKYKVKRE